MFWRTNWGSAEVRYAVRLRVLGKYCGQLCLVMASLAFFPFAASLWFADTSIAQRYGLVILGLLAVGGLCSRIRTSNRIQANEGMVIVVLVFLATPLIMTYPLMASGLSFVDALFEAVSGATTTGLSTVVSIENTPPTFRFARAWMQWYGGLGIVILSLALIVEPGMASKGLGVTESIDDDLLGGLKAYSRRMLAIYSLLTAGAAVSLWLLGAPLWQAWEYAMAAVSTGGFSPHNESLGGLGDWPIQTMVTAICVICAVPLILYHRAYRMRLSYDSNGAQVCALLLSAALVGLLLGGWNVFQGMAWSQAIQQAPLLAFSAQTTAGFSTTDVSALDPFSKMLLMFAMATGGGTGSTAGGFKVLRLLILLRLVSLMILRTSVTRHAVVTARLTNRRLEHPEIREALLIMLLFFAVIIASWLPFVASG